jgi:predicted peptidase
MKDLSLKPLLVLLMSSILVSCLQEASVTTSNLSNDDTTNDSYDDTNTPSTYTSNTAVSTQSGCISSLASGPGVVGINLRGSTSAPYYGFLDYKPAGYSTGTQKYPVIVFLHGLGEQGSETDPNILRNKMSAHGPFKRVNQGRHFPALMFAPQSAGWWDSAWIKSFMIWIENNYRIDKSRIYLTGPSMGGGGTWDYMRYDPTRLAAAIPVCGADWANNSGAERSALKAVPHYSIHNIDDGIVGSDRSESFANSLGVILGATNQVLSGHVAGTDITANFDTSSNTWVHTQGSMKLKNSSGKFHNPPYVYAFDAYGGHNAWTKTYESEETWEWLFCQRKSL